MIFNLMVALLTCLVALYTYIQWKFTYWKRRGLPYHKPNFPLGLYKFPNPEKKHFTEIIQEQYDYFKSQGHKHFGINLGTRPVYVPIHPEVIKSIMVKDFSYFPDRGFYNNEKDDPLNVHLVTLKGQKWKDRREKISPIFSSSKTKIMFKLFVDCSTRMATMMHTLSKNEKEVNMKEISSCYTTDVNGSCVFGIDCNSIEDDQNKFRKQARAFFLPLTTFGNIKWLIAVCSTKLGRFLRISITPKEITNFFSRVIKDNVEFREKTSIFRPDLIQLLIDLKNNKDEGDPNKAESKQNLTLMELTAECFLFFNAGIQSTAASITFCLYELTKNIDIQEILRNEINNVIDKYEGKFTYDNIIKMKYLHQVIEETIRIYPSIYVTTRQCIKDYKVSNSNVTIEKGTLVFLPLSALHHDAEYFPEPEKFDPERFNNINKAKIRPFTYLPFGEGPRYCIAPRFGEMQIKVGVAVLLRNFRFTLNKKSSTLKLDPNMPMSAFKGPAWFNIEKIQ